MLLLVLHIRMGLNNWPPETVRPQHLTVAPTNTLPGMAGTAWAAYNSVSQYFDHQRNFKGANTLEKADHQLESIWFGSSHQAKQDAYQRALMLTGS